MTLCIPKLLNQYLRAPSSLSQLHAVSNKICVTKQDNRGLHEI